MTHKFQGVDKSREISLFEYGFIAQKTTKDYPDEYFVVYKIYDDAYGTGYKRESELDDLINGDDWADVDDIKGFLNFVGMSKEDWLELPFWKKLSDCLNYWGCSNVIGEDYSPMTEKEVYRRYRHLW
jgi:hypothetical protein